MTLKEKIIHESLRQFSTKGFLSTSITDILEAVGTSKGGLYNHFKNKEALFFAALSEARKIWRQRNLEGLKDLDRPMEKIKKLLENYRDRYLADSENFPGGCICHPCCGIERSAAPFGPGNERRVFAVQGHVETAAGSGEKCRQFKGRN
jgi:AcrR family transcriptional regulator